MFKTILILPARQWWVSGAGLQCAISDLLIFSYDFVELVILSQQIQVWIN